MCNARVSFRPRPEADIAGSQVTSAQRTQGRYVGAPIAYRGDESYVFVCYAHDDNAVVYPEINWLHEQGINVWYDEGISPGEEWSEELGQAIDGAERFLYFISPRSVASRHCRNELNFAQNRDKAILSVSPIDYRD